MTGKGQHQPKPKFAGLDERDFTTVQGDVPSAYFAGVAKLNGSPIMNPVVTKTKKSATTGGKGK